MKLFIALLIFCLLALVVPAFPQDIVVMRKPAAGAPSITITRVQFKHQYVATSGTGYAFTSNNTAGNLLVLIASSANSTGAYTVTDTAGNSWSSFPFLNGTTTADIQIFYVLSCAGGANTVTVTATGGGPFDLGWTAVEYNASSGTWAVDSSLPSGSSKVSGGTTTTPTTNTWSTAGAVDLIICGWADESTAQSSYLAGTNFTLIQGDTGHWDAQEEWLNAPPQTNQTASFTISTTSNTWSIYLAAFTAS